MDAEEDRAHPCKRHRPVAAGDVSPRTAAVIGVGLVVVSTAAGFLVNTSLGVVLVLYAVLQILYNLSLKRIPFVDAVAVAIGFGLRAAAGAVAIEVQISIWLLLCVFFLCLYLAFIKRMFDLTSAAAEPDSAWQPAAGYRDLDELNWLLGVSAVLAVMTYVMYTLSAHARHLFDARALGLTLLTPLVLIAIHRFYRRAREGHSDSPLDVLREDRAVLASIILFAAGTLAALYAPAAADILSGVFFTANADAAP